MRLSVAEVLVDTPTVRDFRFDLAGEEEMPFFPGQFVTITTEVPGHGRVTRAYSVASSPTERRHFDLCIKRFADGILSPFMFDHVRPGFTFDVKGPFGKFFWNEDLGRRVALIGAGTGIAPLQSMIRYARAKELDVDLGLLFSNRAEDEIIYRGELERLARDMPNFSVAFTVTRGAAESWAGYRRRIDRPMIAETFPDVAERVCYICGAPEMVNDTVTHLRSLGVPDAAIRTEKYY